MKVLYFGIFDPNFSRNKIYGDGLRQNGVEVIVCTDTSRGLLKYWRLFLKHWKLRNHYDVMIVGFPGYIIVPFAKLISRKPVIFDALCSFYETQIISRDAYSGNIFRLPYVRVIDWLSTRCADIILVETEQQKKYFIQSLGVKEKKLQVVLTGVDDSQFHADPSVKKLPTFTALFRGRITREAGATYVLDAAKLLENAGVDFLVIGYGWGQPIDEFNALMKQLSPKNVRYIREHLPMNEMVTLMQGCHVSLGQFANNERLKRTIPHKAFESLAMKLPYISGRAGGVEGFLIDGENCLLANCANAQDIADKIMQLKNDPLLAKKIADNGFELYKRTSSPLVLGALVKRICERV